MPTVKVHTQAVVIKPKDEHHHAVQTSHYNLSQDISVPSLTSYRTCPSHENADVIIPFTTMTSKMSPNKVFGAVRSFLMRATCHKSWFNNYQSHCHIRQACLFALFRRLWKGTAILISSPALSTSCCWAKTLLQDVNFPGKKCATYKLLQEQIYSNT
jgi:hypothetical protein